MSANGDCGSQKYMGRKNQVRPARGKKEILKTEDSEKGQNIAHRRVGACGEMKPKSWELMSEGSG